MKIKLAIRKIIKKIAPNMTRKLVLWHLKANYLPKEFLDDIAKLDSNSCGVDLGANVGYISECFLQTGALVIAFEPNVVALRRLNTLKKYYKNIIIEPFAAGIKNCETELFLHKDTDSSGKDFSQSSSLRSDKPNVSKDCHYTIKEIDFAEYIEKINRDIDIIKIDIEGYEIQLLNHLLDSDSLVNVSRIC